MVLPKRVDGERSLLYMVFGLSRLFEMAYRMWVWKRWSFIVIQAKNREELADPADLVKSVYRPLQPIRTRWHLDSFVSNVSRRSAQYSECKSWPCDQHHYYLTDIETGRDPD